MRYRPVLIAMLFTSLAVLAQDIASIQSSLNEAKQRYEEGMIKFKENVQKQFSIREEKIRSAKNGISLLKVHRVEKEYFEEQGDLPLWLPTTVMVEKQKLVSDLETAYQKAIRSLTKAKMDRTATQIEKELYKFWDKKFEEVDYKAASIKDGFIRLPKHTAISTREEHTGPIWS